jgi:ABC-type lipoprotein export system ATPase subunit
VLATGPGMILADEPTASLDATSRSTVCAALAELRSAGSIIIVATHDDHVASICDEIWDLDDERLVQR